jgi:uncharacterized protein
LAPSAFHGLEGAVADGLAHQDMSATARNDNALARFRGALTEMYGARLERVVLYGSPEQGDTDFDYEIAVFLENISDRWAEMDKIAFLTTGIFEETDVLIHAMVYPAGAWRERTPLMHEIREQGRDV